MICCITYLFIKLPFYCKYVTGCLKTYLDIKEKGKEKKILMQSAFCKIIVLVISPVLIALYLQPLSNG